MANIGLLLIIIVLLLVLRYRERHADITNELKRLSEEMQRSFKRIEKILGKISASTGRKAESLPATTDFGIMFLSFESIYAKVCAVPLLLEELQRNYKVVVTGPTTLAATLNSLQIGFRTLAIQKYSSEVWTILGAAKKKFEKISGMLEKKQKNLQSASGQIEEVLGTRTRVIQRKLKEVDTLNDQEARAILPEIGLLEKDESDS